MMIEKFGFEPLLPPNLSSKQITLTPLKVTRSTRKKRCRGDFNGIIETEKKIYQMPGVGQTIGVHRCRFVKWMPSAVNSVAWCSDSSKVAIGRANGLLQIYELVHFKSSIPSWRLFASMRNHEGHPIDSVVWTPNNRLFTSGSLSCQIVEWDMAKKKPKPTVVYPPGGSVWALSISKDGLYLAVASEDKQIRLFSVNSDGDPPEYLHGSKAFGFPGHLLNYSKANDKVSDQEFRILCMNWIDDSTQLITGSSLGDIVIWQVTLTKLVQLRSIRTMNLGKNFDGMIWCITYLPEEKIIIAGDSRGQVSFWESSTGTLISTFRVHDSEVLSIISVPDSRMVIATGVDPTLHCFTRVSSIEENQYNTLAKTEKGKTHNTSSSWTWTTGAGLTPVTLHRLDIRAMGISPNGKYLITAGLDPDVLIHHIKPTGLGRFEILSYTDQVEPNLISYHSSSFLISGNYINDPKFSAEVWKMNTENMPTLELRISLDSNSFIISSCLNENWIALGLKNSNCIRLWNKNRHSKLWDISGSIQLSSHQHLILLALSSKNDDDFLWTIQMTASDILIVSMARLGDLSAPLKEWRLNTSFTPNFIRVFEESAIIGCSNTPGTPLVQLTSENINEILPKKMAKNLEKEDQNINWLQSPTTQSYFVDVVLVKEKENLFVIGISNISLLEAERLGRKASSHVSSSKEDVILSSSIISVWKDFQLINRILVPLAPSLSTRCSAAVRGATLLRCSDSLVLYSDRIYSLPLEYILAYPSLNVKEEYTPYSESTLSNLKPQSSLNSSKESSIACGKNKSDCESNTLIHSSSLVSNSIVTECQLEKLHTMLPLILSTPRGSEMSPLNVIICVLSTSKELVVIERSLEDIYSSLPPAFRRAALFRSSS